MSLIDGSHGSNCYYYYENKLSGKCTELFSVVLRMIVEKILCILNRKGHCCSLEVAMFKEQFITFCSEYTN